MFSQSFLRFLKKTTRILGTKGMASLAILALVLYSTGDALLVIAAPPQITMEAFVLDGAYSLVEGQPTGVGEFKNGNISDYPEGACIPISLQYTNREDDPVDDTLTVIYDHYSSNLGFVGLEVLNTSLSDPRDDADDLNDLLITGNDLTSLTSVPTIEGSTISVSIEGPYAGDSGIVAPGATDATQHYNISLTGVPVDETADILFCARMDVDAADYSTGGGANMSIRLADGAQNIAVSPGKLLRLPSLTIQKIVDGGVASPSDFAFTVSPEIGGTSVHSIPSGSDSVTIDNIPDGAYSITESSLTGYALTSGSGTNCEFSGGTAAATVAAGDPATNATCIFTNSFSGATSTTTSTTLTVEKVVVNDGGGTMSVADFELFIDGASVISGEVNDLDPGSYVVSETDVPDYTGVISGDCDEAGNVTLEEGDAKTCVITNTFSASTSTPLTTLTVQKIVINDDNGSMEVSDFELFINGAPVSSGATNEVVPGDYVVSETEVDGYVGVIGGDCDASGAVTLTEGDEKVCTITNDDVEVVEPDQCSLSNILSNGGFEAVDSREGLIRGTVLNAIGSASPRWDIYDSLPDVTDGSGTSWSTVAGSGIEVQYSGVTVTPNSGVHYVELDSHTNSTNGSITNTTMSQTVVLDGGDYELSFWYRPRNTDSNDNLIDVYVDSGLIGTVNSTDTSAWVSHAFTLTGLTAGSHEIAFAATGTQNSLGGFLDDVGLTCAVPSNTDPGFEQTTGTLRVIKTVVNDDLGELTSESFTMHVSGTNPSASSFAGDASGTTVILEEGAYEVTEDSVEGYTGSFSEDCTGYIKPGETRTCTVTNDDNEDQGGGGNPGGGSPTADLSITKETSSSTVILGSEFTYTLTVTNIGPDPATGVVITDMLPASVVYVSSSSTLGVYNSTTHLWEIGAMAVSQTETLEIVVQVTSTDSEFVNTGTVSAIEIDPVSGNNAASVTVGLFSPANDNGGGNNGGGNGGTGGGSTGGGGGSTGGGGGPGGVGSGAIPPPVLTVVPTPTPIVLGDSDTAADSTPTSDPAPEPIVLGATTEAEPTLPVTGVPSGFPLMAVLVGFVTALVARKKHA